MPLDTHSEIRPVMMQVRTEPSPAEPPLRTMLDAIEKDLELQKTSVEIPKTAPAAKQEPATVRFALD